MEKGDEEGRKRRIGGRKKWGAYERTGEEG